MSKKALRALRGCWLLLLTSKSSSLPFSQPASLLSSFLPLCLHLRGCFPTTCACTSKWMNNKQSLESRNVHTLMWYPKRSATPRCYASQAQCRWTSPGQCPHLLPHKKRYSILHSYASLIRTTDSLTNHSSELTGRATMIRKQGQHKLEHRNWMQQHLDKTQNPDVTLRKPLCCNRWAVDRDDCLKSVNYSNKRTTYNLTSRLRFYW